MTTTSGGGLAALSACTLAELVHTRKVSPVEIIDDLLARLDVFEPKLNAFVVLDREGAKSAARAAEATVMRGDALGTLHGVPVTIKDIQAVAGLPTRRGSRLSNLRQLPPTRWPLHGCELRAPSLSERRR